MVHQLHVQRRPECSWCSDRSDSPRQIRSRIARRDVAGVGIEGHSGETKEMNRLIHSVVLLAPFVLAGAAAPQTKPLQEPLKVRIVKVERIRDDRDGVLWFKLRFVFRDDSSRLYHVSADCVASNPESPASCGNYNLPRVGLVYDAVDFGDISIQFVGTKVFYDINSIEISDCNSSVPKRGKP